MGLYDEGAKLLLQKIEEYYLDYINAEIDIYIFGVGTKTFDLGGAEDIDVTFVDDGEFYKLELTGDISWPVSEGDEITEIIFSVSDGGSYIMYYVFDEPIEAPDDTDFNLNKFTVKIPYGRSW